MGKPPILARRGTIVLLIAPAAVELSVWMGLFGWDHPMSMRVCLERNISLAVTKRAASFDLAADAMTNLLIWAMERTAPINCGNGSLSEGKV